MNVYDFDETIYDGNSGPDFFIFCLMRNIKLIRYVPKNLLWLIKYILNPNATSKAYFDACIFLKDMKNIDEYLNKFWDKNMHKIKKWYLEQKSEDDVIISSTPYFLLSPICKKLNIKSLLASDVNIENGKLTGKLYFNEVKVHEFKKRFPDATIENFYTDSLHDKPLIDMAKNAFIIKGNKIIRYIKKTSE
jgi:phosphoserine phosphatase